MKKGRRTKEDSPLVSLARHGIKRKKNTLRNMLLGGTIVIATGVTTIGAHLYYGDFAEDIGKRALKDLNLNPFSIFYRSQKNEKPVNAEESYNGETSSQESYQTQETTYNNK